MKRIPIILIPVLLCWLQFGFAQTPAVVADKQDPLLDSVKKYTKLGFLKKVEPFAKEYAEQQKKEKGPESIEYGRSLDIWGDALSRIGETKEAESLLLLGLKIKKTKLGDHHLDVAESLHNIGRLYKNMGQYSNAENYYRKSLEIRKKELGDNHPIVSNSLHNLGIIYWYMGEFSKAEPYCLEALNIRLKNLGENNKDVASSYSMLGILYSDIGNPAKSEVYYLKSLKIQKNVLGENHPDVGGTLHGLANLFLETGNYTTAERYYRNALEIRKNALGENHPLYAESLHSLGVLFFRKGNYPKAESYYLQSIEIRKIIFGDNHKDVANSIEVLGILYYSLGNFEKAENNYLQALEIRKNILGELHPDVAGSYHNIGLLYRDLGEFVKAQFHMDKALEIWTKNLGENYSGLGSLYNNYSGLLMSIGNYSKTSKYLHSSLEINKSTHGNSHFEVGYSLFNFGRLYNLTGNYSKANSFFFKALEIRNNSFGEYHPSHTESIQSLAWNYFNWRNMKRANDYYKIWNTNVLTEIHRYFPILSDFEKEKFIQSNLSSGQHEFHSFCVQRYLSNKEIGGIFYNNLLATKGLLLNSESKWKHRVRSSGDSLLISGFEKWENLANQMGKLFSSTDSLELVKLKGLKEQKEALEKVLIKQSEYFSKINDTKQYNWQNLRQILKPGEAAIEMVRVWKYGISKIVTDTSDPKKPTYKVKGLTDTAYYAALIVKPTSKYPEMVLLKNGNDLEEKWINFYKNNIIKQNPDTSSYSQFWKKIDAKLGPAVKRVYFSPDGVYNSINLNTLQNPKTGKYLLDERDIRLVTNTKDIVTANVSKPNPAYACLVGFPDYNTDKAKRAAVFQKERNHPESWYNLNLTRSDAFAELPATKTEVENISGLMQTNGWHVESLLGENALEESIKVVQKPRVLHIATHGFFQPDTTKGSNPLIHSGLLLTGANKSLSGEKDDKVDDGILTAYEAMNLNLDNTDLVVLSACETGLGEIKNGEGVYGLQRAFKVAGAKSIIMSLWKVDDEATQELMVSFYKHWLGAGTTGQTTNSKRSAFLKAQKELKAKYPDPYYWGAFVMVGE